MLYSLYESSKYQVGILIVVPYTTQGEGGTTII